MAEHFSSQHRLILMPSGRQDDVPDGITVLEAARQLGIEIESICGGRQTCGKCLVELEEGTFTRHGIISSHDHLTLPDEGEHSYVEKHDLDLTRQRFACSARIIGDVLVTVPEASQARKQVIRKEASDLSIPVVSTMRIVYVEVPKATLDGAADWPRLQTALQEQWGLLDIKLDPMLLPTLQRTLRQEKGGVTVTLWQNREIVRIEPGYVESLYGIAIDVGSTTLAAYLCDLRTGAVLATETMMNPQVRFGEDIVSRITYCVTESQGLHRLHRAIIKALNDLCVNAAQVAGIEPIEITDMVLVGNTVMHHILLGIDPVELGRLPFTLATDEALDLHARDLGLKAVHNGARVHILPCIAGYVGADSVGVLLAEHPYLDDKVTLVVDIGTNAEILLGTKNRILSASSPTGPAFEGAHITHGQRAAAGAIERVRINGSGVRYKVIGDARWSDELTAGESLRPTGICGSAIIEIVGELFKSGLLEGGGRFASDAESIHPCIRRNGRVSEFILATGEESATGRDIIVTQLDIRAIQLAKGALYSSVQVLMDRLGIDRVDRIKLAGAFGSYIDPYYAMQIGLIPPCDLSEVTTIGNAAGDGARIALLNWEQRQQVQTILKQVEYVETAAITEFQTYFVEALALPVAIELAEE